MRKRKLRDMFAADLVADNIFTIPMSQLCGSKLEYL